MNSSDFIKHFVERTGLTPKESKAFIDEFGKYIIVTLKKDKKININHLGVFSIKNIAAKKVRNPNTGRIMTVPAKDKVFFKGAGIFSKNLNAKIAGEQADKIIEFAKKKSREILSSASVKHINFDRLVQPKKVKVENDKPGEKVEIPVLEEIVEAEPVVEQREIVEEKQEYKKAEVVKGPVEYKRQEVVEEKPEYKKAEVVKEPVGYKRQEVVEERPEYKEAEVVEEPVEYKRQKVVERSEYKREDVVKEQSECNKEEIIQDKEDVISDEQLIGIIKYVSSSYRKKMLVMFSSLIIIIGIVGFIFWKTKIPKRIFNRYMQNITSKAVNKIVDRKISEVKSDAVSEEKIKEMIKESSIKLMETEKHVSSKIPLIKIKKYTVKKGDSLWSIANKFSKTPYNWLGIYQNNGTKIKNPDEIYPGQKLLVPVIENNK